MAQLISTEMLHNYPALFTTGLTILLMVLYKVLHSSRPKKNYPPGPPGLPIVGNLFDILFSKLHQHQLIEKWTKKYGRVLWFRVFGHGVVIINDQDLALETFQNNDVGDRSPMKAYEAVIGRTNSGLAFANGPTWKEHRKFFLSIFRLVNTGVCRLEDIVAEQVKKIVEEVKLLNGQKFDPSVMINLSIANIVLRIITGVTYEWDNEEFLHVVNTSARVFDLSGPAALFVLNPTFSALPIPVNWEIRRCVKTIVGFIKNIVDEDKKNFNIKDEPNSFISAYLQEKAKAGGKLQTFDDTNLYVSAVDTLVAGWETVASTLRWSFHIIVTHPEAQDRMREEIHRVVGTGRYPTIADRPNMPLTEATIAECMRFISAVPIHLPHVASCDTKIGGYDVPKGSAVAGNLLHFAKSASIWKDPEEFKPERFIDDNGKFLRNLEPIPFGHGKRACPGEQLARIEMFIYMTYLVQHFKLKLTPGSSTELDGNLGITWRPHTYELQAVDAISS